MNRYFLTLLISAMLVSCAPQEEDEYPGPVFHFVPQGSMAGNPVGIFSRNDSVSLFYPADINNELIWKSASSKDKLQWRSLSGFIPGCEEIPMNNPKRILSGAFVMDSFNRSGLCRTPCLLFLQASWPCESDPLETFKPYLMTADRGNTWVKTNGVVSIDRDLGRVKDPKIFFHKSTQKWIMLATTDQKVHFFESSDLLKWRHVSMFGPAGNTDLQWENPDLIEVPLEHNPDSVGWVLSVTSGHPSKPGFAAVQYFIGQFDGKSFFNDAAPEKINLLDHGRDFISAIRMQIDDQSNGPKEALIVGKIGNNLYGDDLPDKRLHGMLSLTRKLLIGTSGENTTLIQKPEADLTAAGSVTARNPEELSGSIHASIQFKLKTTGTQKRGIHLLKTAGQQLEIGYDPATKSVYIDRSACGFIGFHPEFSGIDHFELQEVPEELNLQIFLDRNIVEVFIGGGLSVITSLIFPKDLYGKAEWFGPEQGNSFSAQVIR